jgi:hypothetical protein
MNGLFSAAPATLRVAMRAGTITISWFPCVLSAFYTNDKIYAAQFFAQLFSYSCATSN